LLIDIDSDKLEMTVEVTEELPPVKTDSKVKTDYFVQPVEGEKRIAGPLAKLPRGKTVINIDPRRYQ
jgi:hypothetical protein